MEAIFRAVLEGEAAVAGALRGDPGAARLRASRDRLVESVPHWLYVGDTALHLAGAALRVPAARLLLESGADANAVNRRGATPLHYSCDPRPRVGAWDPGGQSALVALLIAHGAEVDRGDRDGATALHRAVRARSVAAVRGLLASGASPDRRLARRGSSALHLAARSTGATGTAGSGDEQLEIIALLLEHGADPGARDAAGRTPRDWARSPAVQEALRGRRPVARRGRG